MIRKAFIHLPIALDHPFATLFQAANNLFFSIILFKCPFYKEKVLTMGNILGCYGIEIAFAQCQVVNGIQDVGFSNTIIPNKTVDFAVKFEFSGFKILVVNER